MREPLLIHHFDSFTLELVAVRSFLLLHLFLVPHPDRSSIRVYENQCRPQFAIANCRQKPGGLLQSIGGKVKNDRIDSEKIAQLLRSGMLPEAYAYPEAMRSTRDLLRRRMYLVRRHAELQAHIQNTRDQYNLPAFENADPSGGEP